MLVTNTSECFKVVLQNTPENEILIPECALVSSGKKRSQEEKENLLRRIVAEGHFSCLEHIFFRFHITAPLYIMNQITRHRIASYNQASARYGFHFHLFAPIPDDVLQTDPALSKEYVRSCEDSLALYRKIQVTAINKKRARETLRCLPHTTITEAIMTINMRSLVNYLHLRMEEHAQKEVRFLAQQKNDFLVQHAPITAKAFEHYHGGWCKT
jgi:thymidylate synthase (FAD)